MNPNRPFWSVMIPAYEPNGLLGQAIESVLAQDAGADEMQIEVVDDGSTGVDVERLVRNVAGDRVAFYRRPERGGLCAAWNTCIERAHGLWVHILHQDDLVLPGFYHRLREGIEREPDIGAAYCRDILMDEDGHWHYISPLESREPGIIPDCLERIASGQFIRTPAIVVKRDVYRNIGGYSQELVYTLDWDMWKRIAARYPVWYEPQPLACYRTHNSSETYRLIRTGEDIVDAKKSIEISRAYLPKEIADRVSAKAAERFSIEAVRNARRMLGLRNVSASLAQIRGALRLSPTLKVVLAVIRFFAWAAWRFILRVFKRLVVSWN
ncbi:MAG TPA: glycosyltransferase [Blastocatellia bacterium]|nr:glycosyltransferase [Blastocatellia bacterium]